MAVLTKPETRTAPHPLWTRPPPPPGEPVRTLWARPRPLPGEPRHPEWTHPDARPEWMRSPSRAPQYVVALTLIVAVVVTVTLVALGAGSSPYQASLLSITPISANQVQVTMQVHNGRAVAATPSCQVQVFTPAYVAGNTGVSPTVASFTLGRLDPGAVGTFVRTMTVPSGQAAVVSPSTSSVSCR